MEQVNSYSEKKIQQLEIFTKFATALTEEQQKLQDPYCYIGNNKKDLTPGQPLQRSLVNNLRENSKRKQRDTAQLILRYEDFIKLISSSQRLYSKFSDHSFNLNQVPPDTFGCIFFAVDENNKGYLNINDWFHFNNLLENDNYHLIILYEFFRKFDVERIKVKHEKAIEWAKSKSLSSAGLRADDIRVKSINYANRFLSFDELLLNVDQFKNTIKLLHESVQDEFVKRNGLFLDWDSFRFMKFYENFPHGSKEGAYLSLNSMVTVLQNDLKSEKLFLGFDKLSHLDPNRNCLTLNKNQLVYLLKLFYSHRIPAEVFESLNLTNTDLIKSNNSSITYNVFKDVFYLFQNFDLLNQALIKNATIKDFSERDLREQVISKSDFMSILNTQYNKVNNITEFSPSQINLLFSIVANSKENNRIKKLQMHHQDSQIEDFIQNEYAHGVSGHEKRLETFNHNYQDLSDGFGQDSTMKRFSYPSASVFDLFSKNKDRSGVAYNLTTEDFMKILNPNYLNDLVHQMELHRIQQASLYTNYYFYPIFDSIYNFSLGSVAGCIGATIVYPIDLVKTRLQAQRSASQYKNSIDCFMKIFSKEGIRGLYSGLGPQLMGVAPEKAIKLTVNDFMRKSLSDKSGKLSLIQEIAAGASAGACQVIFTNPLEIVKIRLQVRSEYVTENLARAQDTALGIVKSFGITGLYRGICACLMRDVPFSAIYFPTYAHIKRDIFNFDPQDDTKRSRLKTWELLLAGGLAGMPSAFLTTPFDVIKTRLQIDPRKGETHYKGIIHAAKTILKEESFRSFFKGGAARVLRSSPQFGFTLAAYELFKGMIPLPNDSNEGESSASDDEIPTITNSFTSFFTNLSISARPASYRPTQPEFFSPTVDPYSSNYLNYYYKSCQVAKLFIDVDNNFSKFDFSVYSKFHDYLKKIGPSKN